ncbi:hypothetical protein L6452_27860 [Arctium lappa]|uniref:Uncharacterized protein n=1 Tax=Arctium lappa TaxID=4217 RepID=A0ACB8ZVX3_ARCLA|nr:hypothetical protein L6452_27860 [Arctium lappa]
MSDRLPAFLTKSDPLAYRPVVSVVLFGHFPFGAPSDSEGSTSARVFVFWNSFFSSSGLCRQKFCSLNGSPARESFFRAESVVGSCLGDSVFSLLPPLVKRSSSVDFVTGQPLGYLASWPLFTFKPSLCCVAGGRTGLSRIAFGLKYGVKRFSTLARLGGAGYRVAGSCDRTDTGSAFAELKVIPEDLMSEDDLQFLERTMLRHWVLQWLKLVSWYYTVLASDYVTIEEALSGPVVATDWRAQKDVNSALLNGRDGVMFCTGTLTSIVSGHTLVQQAGVTQPTAEKMEDVEEEKTAGGRFLFIKGPCIARGNRKCAPAHQLKKGGILPYYYEKGKGKGLISRKQHKELLIVNPEMKLQQILLSRLEIELRKLHLDKSVALLEAITTNPHSKVYSTAMINPSPVTWGRKSLDLASRKNLRSLEALFETLPALMRRSQEDRREDSYDPAKVKSPNIAVTNKNEDRVKAFEKCKSFRSQEKGKNSDFLGGGVGDRKLIKDRLRIRTARGTFKEEVR